MIKLFRVIYSCRVEIAQNLPDNAPVRSLGELTAEFKRMLKNELFKDMDITISDDSVKSSVPFD